MIGRVVGKYKLIDQIGEGGMGAVYRAEHVVLGSPAAVKVLLPELSKQHAAVDRFFTEAKAASAIRHVGITEVFDYGRLANDQPFIAMELLRGEGLTGFLARNGGRIDAAIAAEICRQLLAALNAAHVVGVVHRDLKPDNIFLTPDAGAPGGIRVKVLDFGIAKLIGDQVQPKLKTKGTAILGTPSYMAPEQCKGGMEIDARADLYAVGCILYELLVGSPPFVAEGGGEIMAMHIYEAPPRLSASAPELPTELDALIAKLLTKAPDDRAPSAAWALATLERVPLESLDGFEVPLAGRGSQVSIDLRTASGGAARPDTSGLAMALGTPSPVEPEQDARGMPGWVPIVIVVIALALAAAAVYYIGLSDDTSLKP